VAGGQDYEVRYEPMKTGRSASAVKKAVKKVGNARKRVEKRSGAECAERKRGQHRSRRSDQPSIPKMDLGRPLRVE
jgi:hypothetical protein